MSTLTSFQKELFVGKAEISHPAMTVHTALKYTAIHELVGLCRQITIIDNIFIWLYATVPNMPNAYEMREV